MATKFKQLTMSLAAVALIIGVSNAALAAEYEGVWKVADSKGVPFEITLNKDGTATATHTAYRKKGMKGTWKEEGGAAEISWETGWITRIVKQGDKYVKYVFKKGVSPSGPPSNSSDAEKKQ